MVCEPIDLVLNFFDFVKTVVAIAKSSLKPVCLHIFGTTFNTLLCI